MRVSAEVCACVRVYMSVCVVYVSADYASKIRVEREREREGDRDRKEKAKKTKTKI